jgi:hypothetical protein
MKKSKVISVDFDSGIADSLAKQVPLSPFQYVLIKELDKVYVEVEKELVDAENPANKGKSTADPDYKFRKQVDKEEAMFQKGVVIKLDQLSADNRVKPRENFPNFDYSVGDVIIYPGRASMTIDIMPGYVLVRPFDVIGKWDIFKENKEPIKKKLTFNN